MREHRMLRDVLKLPYAAAIWTLVRTIIGFAGVSGIGLLLDFSLFETLDLIEGHPSIANVISSTVGTSFVYFASVRNVFRYNGKFMFVKWIIYIIYQVLLITTVSFIIGNLSENFRIQGWVIKISVTPFTFLTNFIFMSVLTGYFSRQAKTIR